MNISMDQISFLLGSGISVPAEFLSVKTLTDTILSGDGIMRHTDGNYYLGQPLYSHMDIPDEYVPKVVSFLNRVKKEIDLYYLNHNAKITDYEDLYYVIAQIRDSELSEYDNPVVQPFIDKILPKIEHLLGDRLSTFHTLHELTSEATNYIKDTVWHILSKEPSRLDHLSCIKEACLDNNISSVHIYTLNHDTILEQYFSQNNLQVCDGFTQHHNEEVRCWNPDVFENDESKVHLIKLHGSVNWFRLRPEEGDWYDEKIVIPFNKDYWHIIDSRGKRQWPVDGRPIFLAGTFNKMLDYNTGIYADLHYHFYKSLKRSSVLIIIGYGFHDKGINSKINDWMYSSRQNKIIVIHPEPDKLCSSARGAISNQWYDWQKNNKLFIIEKLIEETSWEEIFECINNKNFKK